MSTQAINLEALRAQAQGVHKNVVAALAATQAEQQKHFAKAAADAKALQAKLTEAAAAQHAELKAHLQKAAAQLDAIAAVDKTKIQQNNAAIRDAANRAVEHISEAIAAARKHSPASKN